MKEGETLCGGGTLRESQFYLADMIASMKASRTSARGVLIKCVTGLVSFFVFRRAVFKPDIGTRNDAS